MWPAWMIVCACMRACVCGGTLWEIVFVWSPGRYPSNWPQVRLTHLQHTRTRTSAPHPTSSSQRTPFWRARWLFLDDRTPCEDQGTCNKNATCSDGFCECGANLCGDGVNACRGEQNDKNLLILAYKQLLHYLKFDTNVLIFAQQVIYWPETGPM